MEFWDTINRIGEGVGSAAGQFGGALSSMITQNNPVTYQDPNPPYQYTGTKAAPIDIFGGGLARTLAGQSKPATTPSKTTTDPRIAALEAERDAYLKLIADFNKPKAAPYIPPLDVSSAYGTAVTNVSPYFDTLWNNYKANNDRLRKQAEQDYTTTTKNLEKNLGDFLEQSAITKARTGEDVATNLTNIATDENARQITEGRQFDQGIGNLRDKLAETGLTYSGLGQKNVADARLNRSESETAQETDVKRKQESLKLFETRTFADLARGDVKKTEATAEGKRLSEQEKNRTFEDLLYRENEKKGEWEIQKKQGIDQEATNVKNQLFEEYLNKLSPEQRIYANQYYGGGF